MDARREIVISSRQSIALLIAAPLLIIAAVPYCIHGAIFFLDTRKMDSDEYALPPLGGVVNVDASRALYSESLGRIVVYSTGVPRALRRFLGSMPGIYPPIPEDIKCDLTAGNLHVARLGTCDFAILSGGPGKTLVSLKVSYHYTEQTSKHHHVRGGEVFYDLKTTPGEQRSEVIPALIRVEDPPRLTLPILATVVGLVAAVVGLWSKLIDGHDTYNDPTQRLLNDIAKKRKRDK
jgi:hypothetical protein